MHVLRLTDPENPIGGLILDGRVPPAGKMDDVVSRSKRQPHSARSWREDHHIEAAGAGLKRLYKSLTLMPGHTTAYPYGTGGKIEFSLDQARQPLLHGKVFHEHESLFSCLCYPFENGEGLGQTSGCLNVGVEIFAGFPGVDRMQ